MKFILIYLLLVSSIAFAEDLRFSTERPTKIRAPLTINESHFMFEHEFANFSENTEADSQSVKLMQTLVRYGLTPKLELQTKITPFVKQRVKSEGRWDTTIGMSNTEFGMKYNLAGNDGGKFSISVQPYTVLPTSSANLQEEKVQGGISFPMSYQLPAGWSSALMLEMNTVAAGLDWQTNYISSANVSHSLFLDTLIGYIEIYHEQGANDESSNITTLDLVLQYDIYDHVKIDVGTFIGLSPAAEDTEVFTGGSFLF